MSTKEEDAAALRKFWDHALKADNELSGAVRYDKYLTLLARYATKWNMLLGDAQMEIIKLTEPASRKKK